MNDKSTSAAKRKLRGVRTSDRTKCKLTNKKESETHQRCKQWLIKQKSVKNKTQPVEEELPSDDSEDDFPSIRLEPNDEVSHYSQLSIDSLLMNGCQQFIDKKIASSSEAEPE